MAENTPPRWKPFNAHLNGGSAEGESSSSAGDARRDGRKSGRQKDGNRSRSERAAAAKPSANGRRRVAPTEQTNNKGERVLKTYGTTKRSKENPVRLTDGKVHPVTVRKIGDPK